MKRHILLIGAPGCGKTTVVRRTVERLRCAGAAVFGFWTGELRVAGVRCGFEIESLAGKRSVMAHVTFRGGPSVSRYGVDIGAINDVAVSEIRRALAQARPDAILVMDEIGKMELLSPQFRDAVRQALDSPLRLLATAMTRAHPFVDAVKQRPDVEILSVTPANRESLPDVLARQLAPAG